MDTVTISAGSSVFTIKIQRLADDRPVIIFDACGVLTSSSMADCLKQLDLADIFTGHAMAVFNSEKTHEHHVDAHGIYLQAGALIRARISRLHVCFLSEHASAISYADLVSEIFNHAKVHATVQVRPNLEQALAWLAEQT